VKRNVKALTKTKKIDGEKRRPRAKRGSQKSSLSTEKGGGSLRKGISIGGRRKEKRPRGER